MKQHEPEVNENLKIRLFTLPNWPSFLPPIIYKGVFLTEPLRPQPVTQLTEETVTARPNAFHDNSNNDTNNNDTNNNDTNNNDNNTNNNNPSNNSNTKNNNNPSNNNPSDPTQNNHHSSPTHSTDLSSYRLENILHDIYPKITLVDLALLHTQLTHHNLQIDWHSLLTQYQIRESENLYTTLRQVLHLPNELQLWLHQKDVTQGDLAPLRAIDSLQLTQLKTAFQKLAALQPTKADGVRALEWLIDLFLMQKYSDNFATQIHNENLSWSEWYRLLEAARYPNTTQNKKSSEDKIKTLPWPKRSEVRISRRGDQTGVELKLFAQNATELRAQVDGLNLVVKEIDTQDIKSF